MTARWRVELGEWKTLVEQREAAYRLLGQLVGGSVVVEHDASGAPFLPALPDLHVSISHCRKAVAVAVNEDAAIGIDIESRRRVSSGLVERVCTAMEREAIEAIKAAEELARQENARRDREAWELFHGSQNQEQASSFDDDARQAGEKCLALGIDERQIMAWLEKYPSSLLGKAADMAAGMDTKHAVEYMEAILRHSSAKA